MLTEEFIKDKINPLVGYLVNSGRGAAMCGLPDSADWEYLREGTSRIKALLESELANRDAERFCLIQDEDSHWYLIKASRREAFQTWVDHSPYWDGYKGHDFSENRIDGYQSLTFAAPREEPPCSS